MAKHLTIAEFMSTQVTSVDCGDNLLKIAQTMQRKNISCVIVHDQTASEDNSSGNPTKIHPIGIITERDIVRFIARQTETSMASVSARALMPPTLVTIHEQDSLFEAMVLCRSQRVKHLAVVDDHQDLAGIITYSDLVDANLMQIEMQAELIDSDDDATDINAQLLEMTLTDPMLKVGNRRSMEIDLKQTHELSVRYQRPYSIALIDIDYFKKFNDHYGHQHGDQALITAADKLKDIIRGGDRLYRFGGEEFLLLMPEANDEAAGLVGERIVAAVADLGYPHEQSPFKIMTTSVGSAAYEPSDDAINPHAQQADEIQQLIEAADNALYAAKSAGRNRAKTAQAV